MTLKTTGQKIKELRIEKGMTQKELGDKIGVKIAAINKYETGLVVNLKRSTIAKLSEALGTTPIYLMGWDDDTAHTDESQTGLVLTDEEKELIKRFRTLHPAAKKFIFNSVTAQQEPIKQDPEAEAESKRIYDDFKNLYEDKLEVDEEDKQAL